MSPTQNQSSLYNRLTSISFPSILHCVAPQVDLPDLQLQVQIAKQSTGEQHTHTHRETDLCVVTVVLGNAHDDRSMIVRRRYIAVSRHERDQHTYPDDRQLPTAGIHCTLTRFSRRHLQRQLGMSVSCEFIHLVGGVA